MNNNTENTFRRIPNPYGLLTPVREPKMFFGRDEDFAYVRERVTAGGSGGIILLGAARKTGKSSFLFQIANGRLGDDVLPVLVDMQMMEVENELDFYVRWGQRIVEAVGDPEITLEKDFLGKRGAEATDSARNSEAFEYLIGQVVKRANGKRLVLLFDEYEIFADLVDQRILPTNVLNLFYRLTINFDGVFIIFAGAEQMQVRESAQYWRRLLSKAPFFRKMSFLEKADTLRLITEPLKGIIHYENGVPERIYELTAGQPFYTQLLCYELVSCLNGKQKYDATLQDLTEIVDRVINNPPPQMKYDWDQLDSAEKLALSMLGELNQKNVREVRQREILAYAGAERIGYKCELSALNEALERLFQRDLLSKREGYNFRMDLWRLWVGRMRSIWQVVNELNGLGDNLGKGVSRVKGRHAGRLAIFGAVLVVVLAGAIYGLDLIPPRERESMPPTPESAWLTVTTIEPGARVFLNGKYAEMTPYENMRITPGTDTLDLKLTRTGYKDWDSVLVIPENDTLSVRDVRLQKRTGGLRITSDPPNATIKLTGIEGQWTTPYERDSLWIEEKCEIKARADCYEPRDSLVTVIEDSIRSIFVELPRSHFKVVFLGAPQGAVASVDGHPIKIDADGQEIACGNHEIVVEADSFVTWKQNIPITTAKNIFVNMDTKPRGQLTVQIRPCYGDVYVDDFTTARDHDTRFYADEFPAGRHRIKVVYYNGAADTATVMVKSGQDTLKVFDCRHRERDG